MKDPFPLSGARVEPADVSLDVLQGPRRVARQMRGADQDRVAGDDRRSVQADLASEQIDVLIHPPPATLAYVRVGTLSG